MVGWLPWELRRLDGLTDPAFRCPGRSLFRPPDHPTDHIWILFLKRKIVKG